MLWETRYSPAEMYYVEVTAKDVQTYLHGYQHHATHYTFEQVVEGALDAEVRNLFGAETLAELKAEVQRRLDV
jgi:hypothetical protein